jgi:hypothetical protein
MLRQLPKNRTRLRLIVGILLPAYLVLWIAGTGCLGELYWYGYLVESCVFSMALGFPVGTLTEQEIAILTVTTGVDVYLPLGYIAVSGSTSDSISEFRAYLAFYTALGILTQRLNMMMSTSMGGLGGSADLPASVMMAPGDFVVLSIFMSAVLSDYFGVFRFVPTSESESAVPVFSFPENTARAKFAKAFDAEFGVDYEVPEGRLVINGSVEVPDDARAKIPKKVIVEIAHLSATGAVLAKHKQIVKIRKNGTFKPAGKAFKGFDMEAGERVRLRLKPKRGDLTGLNWMLMPELIS